jgi:hypothetical protein
MNHKQISSLFVKFSNEKLHANILKIGQFYGSCFRNS